MNDLLTSLKCPVLAFADDFKLYLRILNALDQLLLQSSLEYMHEWCLRNKLILNMEKCFSITFTRKSQPLTFGYHMAGQLINVKDQIHDLGVFTYVISKLEYASLIWFPIYNCHLVPLERIHRKFFKYVTFRSTGRFPERGADLSIIMSEMRISSLLARREEQCARFAQRLLNYRIDCPYLLSKMSLNVPRLVTRSREVFYLPTARTNIFERCPVYSICRSADRLELNMFS
ncbi:uncharacterized protein LOC123320016 [Coccinella septempunctata]|uniref:uncharacterized protein LOC123311822 n=1 Tax=Coccinella septempunctata TaxID=41139 RepID=UPI001D082776|nr:uncharacterized protein LOC123311822 [Coccinella septempunctata]XP_044752375.1 uncharacterized protein LOC123312177 [Coccinella septempunctata]XP_044763091.1 uncharacterized protein LOC123320016 [Coccinella septempunctata]